MLFLYTAERQKEMQNNCHMSTQSCKLVPKRCHTTWKKTATETKNNYKETQHGHRWRRMPPKRPSSKTTTQQHKWPLRSCKTTRKRHKTTINREYWDATWSQADGQWPWRIGGRNLSQKDNKTSLNTDAKPQQQQRDAHQSQTIIMTQWPWFKAPISITLRIFRISSNPFYISTCNLQLMSGWWRCCNTFSSLRQSRRK